MGVWLLGKVKASRLNRTTVLGGTVAWTDPRTWVAGETVTAALMNTHVRDNLKAIGDAWTAYTPTWSSDTTQPSIGNGSISGAFLNAGKLTLFRISLTIGSTTTFGTGNYRLSAPSNDVDGVRWPIGQAMIRDSSAADIRVWPVISTAAGTNTIQPLNPTSGTFWVQGTPFTLANGDEVRVYGMYEAT